MPQGSSVPTERHLLIEAKQLGDDGRPTEAARGAAAVLIRMHRRAIWGCVNRMGPKSEEAAEDLFQEGVVGLLEAIHRFDLDRLTDAGTPPTFLTYALHWIRLRVQRGADKAYRPSSEVLDGDPDARCAAVARCGLTVDVLSALSADQREVICRLYGAFGRPLLSRDRIAERMGIDKQAVIQLERSAMETLRRLVLIPPVPE